MQLYKQIQGNRNGMRIGVHSCLFGFAGIGYRYVIYYPERYADMSQFINDKMNECLIETSDVVESLSRDGRWMVGLAGISIAFDNQWAKKQSLLGKAVPCDVLLGPVLMPSRLWASISASRGVNERPWEESDELAVSLLAGGVKISKATRYVVHDTVLASAIDFDSYDTQRWWEIRNRIRKAGG